MSADVLASAILQYIDHGAFPQDEQVASARVDSHDALTGLTTALRTEQDVVKEEIRGLSQAARGDVDVWIVRAKELQADILQSRETARQIVAEAEAARELRGRGEDKERQVRLLEGEVGFQEGVVGRLEHIRHANGVLGEVQELLVAGLIDDAMGKLEAGDESVGGLTFGDAESGVSLVLARKVEKLRERVREAVDGRWRDGVSVDVEERRVTITTDVLNGVVNAAQGLHLFDGFASRMSRDIERAIVRPRLAVSRDGTVASIIAEGGLLSCGPPTEDISSGTLFADLSTIVDFLATQLPPDIAVSLSQTLIPTLATHLQDEWLEPAVPLDVSDMPSFQDLLSDVAAFADQIDALGWHGSKTLHDWVQAAPRTWLTKRREGLLGDVRNLVFTGIREKKTVERIETQMVSKEDALAGGGDTGDDDWDTAWDEPEQGPDLPPSAVKIDVPSTPVEDEDMDAWDEEPEEETSKEDGDDEGDAWGWNDDAEMPATPKAQKLNPNQPRPASKPVEREMTLRETFTVTATPDGILELVTQVIADAQTLAGPDYSKSPIAPAATGLYTLPTLALAIYRATASTAYAKLDTGNMLIYNDAMRLAEQLRAWQAEQPPASRLRLDNDVTALEQFAKQAYSAEMESQRIILLDLLDGAQGFSNSSMQPFKTECESAVEQTILRLRDVHRMWTPILSHSALLQSVGSLLSTILSKIITEVEDLPDISEADSKQLKLLCDSAMGIKDIFLAPSSGVDDGTDQQPKRDMTFVYCPNWLKFAYLGEILEASLADIRYLWKEGELSLEFGAEEVVGLIEALFSESTLRRQAIGEVRRGGR